MFNLTGKVVLITGSSSGVGLVVAEELKKAGATVITHSHLPKAQCELLLASSVADDIFIQQDLSQLHELERFVNMAWDLHGRIDILINNAGIYNEPGFLELSPEILLKTMNVNLHAPILITHHWAKLCVRNQIKGKVIFTSSINARLSEHAHVSYDASKGGLEAGMRSIALELARYGITSNAVELGLVYTPLTAPFIDQTGIRAQLDHVIPLGVTQLNDVAGVYLFLASDLSSACTGGVFPADGGTGCTQVTAEIQ